jgi:hypothetical protein
MLVLVVVFGFSKVQAQLKNLNLKSNERPAYYSPIPKFVPGSRIQTGGY